MSKAVTITDEDAQHKARAEGALAEAQRILRALATDRRRSERARVARPRIITEVKAILQGA